MCCDWVMYSGGHEMIRRVLVADDERDIRDLLRIVLEDEGYEVVTRANGKETVDFLLAAREPWIVLLDVMMPYLSGLDVCRRLTRWGPRGKQHRIILMTASDLPESACPSVAQTRLRKPVCVREIVELVDSLADAH